MTYSYISNLVMGNRRQGNTSALVEVLLQNPNAKMVVESYDFAKALSRKYRLDLSRFITVDNLDDGLCSCMGPVVYDIPAIIRMIEKERNVAKDEIKKEISQPNEKTIVITSQSR